MPVVRRHREPGSARNGTACKEFVAAAAGLGLLLAPKPPSKGSGDMYPSKGGRPCWALPESSRGLVPGPCRTVALHLGVSGTSLLDVLPHQLGDAAGIGGGTGTEQRQW